VKTSTLKAQSPAKLNLFLHIVGQRPNGYHNLESIFCPIELYDHIQISLTERPDNTLELQRSGDLMHIPATKDLTVRACETFFKHAPVPQGWTIHVHVQKTIPEQAGLGGGSSNAATILQLLQQHFNHPLNPQQLHTLALQLGADVPFFLSKQSAFVEGIGEQITPISAPSGHVLIFKPPIACATQEIFSDPLLTKNSESLKIAVFDSVKRLEAHFSPTLAKDANKALFEFLKAKTCNALQFAVERKKIEWKHYFECFSTIVSRFDPLLIRMTGSGSAMFAVFASPSQLSSAAETVAEQKALKTGLCFKAQIKQNEVE
jgi:4-diphosphocytidyl-2-C-methyl-D-erythritol kinase